ncbi:hypothetical protein PRK78_005074 [Emydomyces testavorans]|uniref:DUF7079 domain-containing protein n=1 Tax=Emydomyces testavorans TaxID=2070801 RepID=A0AAF0DMP5_9EURO|nr:hypothetical protein PRK78_005074 [Emydomyces testavorans]
MAPSTSMLTEAERRACVILSTLFLDTEITATTINDMARSLRPLQIPAGQLEQMLRNDVFPVLYPNLASTAGVWNAFDETDLINRVANGRAQGSTFPKSLGTSVAWLVLGGSVSGPWKQVKEKLQQPEAGESPRSSCLVRSYMTMLAVCLPSPSQLTSEVVVILP